MISIIIPTYNEEENIKKIIKSIKQNKGCEYEIIVVDNNSKDKTKIIAKSEGCIVIDNPKQAKVGLSRNMGAKKSKGEIIYFIDADWELVGEDHLLKVDKYFKKNKNKKCGAPILKRRKDTLVKKIISIENESPLIDEGGHGAYIYRKDFFFEIGGFEDSLGFGEDKKLTSKIKRYSGWIKGVYILQDMIGNMTGVFKQGKWYGKGFVDYFKETKDVKHFISMFFWMVSIPLIIFSVISSKVLTVFSIYLLLISIISFRYFIQTKDPVSFLAPIVKVVRSYGELSGIISNFFKY